MSPTRLVHLLPTSALGYAPPVPETPVTINEITSNDGSVTVTSPFGPITDLSVPASGYASLTGAGRTVSPGDLSQVGGLSVTASSAMGIHLNSGSGSGITIADTFTGTGGQPIVLGTQNSDIQLAAGGAHGNIYLQTTTQGVAITAGGSASGPPGAGIIVMTSINGTHITDTSTTGGAGIFLSAHAGIGIADNSSAGMSIAETGTGNFQIVHTSTSGLMAIQATGSNGQIVMSTGSGGTTGGNIIISSVNQVKIVSPKLGGLIRIGEGVSPFTHAVGLILRSDDGLFFENLPTINPGGSGQVWNNGGVLSIT